MGLTKDELNKRMNHNGRNTDLMTTNNGSKGISTAGNKFGLSSLSESLKKTPSTSSKKEFLEEAKKTLLAIKETHANIIFIFDKSASCEGTETDTINGFNSLIKSQTHQNYKTLVSTILFDESFKILYEGINSKKVPSLSYYANGGSTALYDALCKNLSHFREKIGNNENTFVVIMTDGDDNDSSYSVDDAKEEVSKCIKLGWQFLFLGNKINAKSVAASLGINPEFAEDYVTENGGILKNFDAIKAAIDSKITTGRISSNWATSIKEHNKNLQIDGQKRYLLGGK